MNVQFDTLILKYSKIYGIPFSIIKGIIEKESGFNPNAIGDPCKSTKGKRAYKCPDGKFCSFGLGQANWCSGTAQNFWKVNNYKLLFDPETAIKGIANYLSYQYKRYGDWKKAISAYNAGTYTKKNPGYVSEVWRNVTKYELQGKENLSQKNNTEKKNETELKNDWLPFVFIAVGIIIIIKTFKNNH